MLTDTDSVPSNEETDVVVTTDVDSPGVEEIDDGISVPTVGVVRVPVDSTLSEGVKVC